MLVPGSVNPLLLTSAAGAAGGGVSRSLRFNSADSAYLSRTPGSAGNRKTWTYSCWVKRAKLGAYTSILSTTGNNTGIRFDPSTNKLELFDYPGSYSWRLLTTQTFRDPSAWFHLVFALDTTQSTSTNRGKLYINGSQVTVFDVADYPSLNFEGPINNNTQQAIGDDGAAHDSYFDGYLADVYFIDGQALTPSSFTETDATTGQLIPKAFTGSYGTNGFHLEFSDNSGTTSTTLGKDAAGSNNWTPNNFSVASGSGNDSLVDTPTSYGTDTSVGGEVRGNYCTWNPLDNGSVTLSNGNLDGSATVAWKNVRGTIAFPSSGKWYFEVTPSGSALLGVGIAAANKNLTDQSTGTFVTYNEDGRFYKDGSINATGKATYTSGDVIGVAFDCDTNSVTFYKNNVSQGSVTPTTGVTYFPFVQIYNSSLSANWGQRPFAYTAPSGFKALCDTNLPAPVVAKPNTVMDVKLYTGNGSTQTISGLGFSPDLVWSKSRSSTYSHRLQDTVRGATKTIYSNSTSAEETQSQGLTAFTSDGFTIGSDPGNNDNNVTYVAWTWDAGSSTVTNTQGSITSSVRANASAGFSIVTYTGNATAGATVGHGLNARLGLYIIKNRDTVDPWIVFGSAIDLTGANGVLILNSTAARSTSATTTATTSTTFPLSQYPDVNGNGQRIVAYCFAPVAGYSSFGIWQHNNSNDGPFIYTGFRPKLILLKNSDNAEQWFMFDSARRTYNLAAGTDTSNLRPNSSGAEGSYSNQATIDFLSNGFKIRTTTPDEIAFGTRSYIYGAWAESPFQFSRAR